MVTAWHHFCSATPTNWQQTLQSPGSLIYGREHWGHERWILEDYLFYTFETCYRQKKLCYFQYGGRRWAAFNTGLITEDIDDIICLFSNPRGSEDWIFSQFIPQREALRRGLQAPLLRASYFISTCQMSVHPESHIMINSEAIAGRRELAAFLSAATSAIGTRDRVTLAVQRALSWHRSNHRLLVPQFDYVTDPEHSALMERMAFLMPLCFDGEMVDLVLVIEADERGERESGEPPLPSPPRIRYVGTDVLPAEVAYRNARLLGQVDSNWLWNAATGSPLSPIISSTSTFQHTPYTSSDISTTPSASGTLSPRPQSQRPQLQSVQLSETQRSYVRYLVVVHPLSLELFTVGIRHVCKSRGAYNLLQQLEENLTLDYKRGATCELCTAFLTQHCSLGSNCPRIHVTRKGWESRRPWAKSRGREN
eukprot:NODE_867_length_1853_cov_15.763304_g775_i0.p1 GENE.NODE_867_length_1853_cov_15.763304_g775_i0~~NODE_867_length_1853_cov_15.763304_g775_i0.p1  ORF type:complete len:423 (+),score=25.93 NODE_867_length_1853_cov_15.763304_g775_i0:58-1326(+)